LESCNNDEYSKDIKNMNLLYVANCFKDHSVKMIFRFLCSPDCNNGETFINTEKTNDIFSFVKLVTTRNCIIEVSDHSMGSFFKNWNNNIMQMISPIEILDFNHAGPFKMYGLKNNFIQSTHPTLNQIGHMSSSDNIEITFNNMGGTKVFKIIESESSKVTIISKGIQLNNNNNNSYYYGITRNEDIEKYYQEVPVHCEFEYGSGKIVVSATHWCNLNSVNTPVDIPSIIRYCTDTFGDEATQDFEYTLSCAQNDVEYNRIISDTVREISSGSRPVKKTKFNS